MNAPPGLDILYIDEELLAVIKPAGIPVIHDSHRPELVNLTQRLEVQFGKLWVLHRLDLDTSGVLLYARSAAAHRQLSHQFEARSVKKTYHLLACGVFRWRHIEADTPLRLNGDRSHRTVPDPLNGKPAKTEFSILQPFGRNLYLISASPYTGYTHQIRAHLSSLNGCILNDHLYRPHPFPPGATAPFDPTPCEEWAAQRLPIRRLALHASEIRFIHPSSQDEMVISAPFPGDFARSVEILNKTSQA